MNKYLWQLSTITEWFGAHIQRLWRLTIQAQVWMVAENTSGFTRGLHRYDGKCPFIVHFKQNHYKNIIVTINTMTQSPIISYAMYTHLDNNYQSLNMNEL